MKHEARNVQVRAVKKCEANGPLAVQTDEAILKSWSENCWDCVFLRISRGRPTFPLVMWMELFYSCRSLPFTPIAGRVTDHPIAGNIDIDAEAVEELRMASMV